MTFDKLNLQSEVNSRVKAQNSIEFKLNNYMTEKHGHFTAGELVVITHRKQTPWDIAGRGKEQYVIIKNDIIKKYHCNERV